MYSRIRQSHVTTGRPGARRRRQGVELRGHLLLSAFLPATVLKGPVFSHFSHGRKGIPPSYWPMIRPAPPGVESALARVDGPETLIPCR